MITLCNLSVDNLLGLFECREILEKKSILSSEILVESGEGVLKDTEILELE